MLENPKVQVEILIPMEQIKSQIVLHNEEIANEINKGIDAGMRQVCSRDYIENIARDAVVNAFKESFNTYRLKSMIEEIIMSKVKDKLEADAENIIKNIKL